MNNNDLIDLNRAKTAEEKAERYANLMIAVAVITGIYFVVWALIGLIL